MEQAQKINIAMDFIKYCANFLSLKEVPRIIFTNNNGWAKNMRTFGQYQNDQKLLMVYIKNRNLADILRTLGHELVHHKQNEDGKLDPKSGETGSDIENEANSIAGVIMRNYGKMNSMIYESVVKEDKRKYEVYCDMDGVLCDFDSQFEHYTGMSPEEYISEKGQKSFDNVVNEAGEEFWATMPWTSGGQALWNKIGKHGVTILSSPGDYEGAKQGKKIWIKNNLNPQPKDIIFRPTGQKHKEIMGKDKTQISNSILIDDYSKNLIPWKYMGGKAIKYDHTDYRDALSKIEKL
jgi:hypothetical protein